MTARTDEIYAFLKANEDEDDLHVDFIEVLCGASPNDFTDGTPARTVALMVMGCDAAELVELCISYEICPVHTCDAQSCLDDKIGDGLEHCGDTVAIDKPLAELVAGDVLDMGVFSHFVGDPDPGGRAGWVHLAGGMKYAESDGAVLRVWVPK